jgi:peptidyl-prolyl cis-trans isomerase SurA
MMKKYFWMLLIALTARTVSAQALADGVVAVVGDEVLLKSDVDTQLQVYAYQNRVDPRTPGLWRQTLDAMINSKLILTRAKQDSLTVAQTEIEEKLTRQLKQLQQRIGGTEEDVAKYYNQPLPTFKVSLRTEIKNQSLIQQAQQKKMGTVTVSNEEVTNFYNAYKDSLPEVPAEVEISHIVAAPTVDSVAKMLAYVRIKAIQDSLKAGVNFSTLATKYSEDPGSAKAGGDLGFVKRGEFVKKFEEVAFGLKEKEVSDIVETVFGYHIIQLIAKKGEAINTRHILIRFDHTKFNETAAVKKLEGVRNRILSGELSFGAAARQFSEDETSAQQGGDIINQQVGTNRIAYDELDPQFKLEVDSLKVGDISLPTRIRLSNGDFAYHIVLLKYKRTAHKMNLTDDYTRIKDFVVQQRRGELFEKWMTELRNDIFWKVKI